MIFNAARTHLDGKWRALHQHPVYGWMKAAGAVYRNTLAWNLQQRLGIAMEQYGREGEFTRIAGMPEELTGHWSKRRAAIIEAARDMGFTVEGNAARAAAANKITRAGKSPDNDPEIRHRRWRREAEGYVERETLIASLLGKAKEITQGQIRELTAVLEDLPERLTREEAVFRLPDIVERVGNATAGLLNRAAVATGIERVIHHPDVVRLTRPPRSAEGKADMAHTRLYSTGRTLEMEQGLREMAAGMAADRGHELPAQAVEAKVAGLLDRGYPLSDEQIAAIRSVTSSGGRVAIIEGAAGSGKTTTLRPIADLYREHGKTIIATAVAWRTAVALGNDVDARPFCVDKLLRLAARGGIEIGKDTTIIVDEAGMLSTRQAHHILRLSERHGAKIVFAGDTQQQQPVEAGPGLRLIRDAVGRVRVDRIRRQRADLEDILVHVHGETPEAARFRAGLMGDQERGRIVADYEAMAEKPIFTPWQVAASEALRDGDAASAIAAHHARGRFHIGYNEEKTLTSLVDDWDRYSRQHPDKSCVVLARTRAEAAALSHLMRERRFAAPEPGERTGGKRVTVHVSRGTEDERAISPLEIAVGDRLRIGATHWEKQLFNGTVVTVEDLKVQRGKVLEGPEGDGPEPAEPPVIISARTDDGRKVKFRHDEIRDWYGNIRLDHGYALTIASAQGLTVDRTFLLADARPARETIYPAATRHRDGLGIYVNRVPLALDVADRRADSDIEAPVTDSEIRAYLAERWSRSQPKEAALDYMEEGVWRDRREDTRKSNRRSAEVGQEETDEVQAAANDNALARIARDIRRTAFGWRHGQAVAAFAAGRSEILAAYDDLRERTRSEGDAVALGGAFRETLTRHGVLLKQAEAFRARPADFASLLAERGGIGRKELDAFEELHARASRHRRAATMRHVHRIKREAELAPARQPEPERRVNVAAAPDHAVQPAGTDTSPARPDVHTLYEAVRRDWNRLVDRASETGVPTFDMEGSELLIARMRPLTEQPELPAGTRQALAGVLEDHQRHAAARKRDTVTVASPAPDESAVGPDNAKTEAMDKARAPSPAPPAWRPAYEAFVRDWNALSEDARQSGTLLFYSRGYAGLIPRLQRLAENPNIPDDTRTPLIQEIQTHQLHVTTRQKVEDWLTAVERHMDRRDSLEDTAGNLDVPVAEAPEYPGWRREAEHLTTVGKDILSGTEAYGAHLANITRGGTRMKWGLSDLRDAIRETAEERTERTAREQPIEPARDWSYWNELAEDARLGAGPTFDSDTGSLVPPDTTPADGTRLEGALSRLRRTFGWESWEDHMKKRAEEDMRRAQNRWEKLKQDWNRAVEQAKQAGIHVIYTRDYKYLRGDLERMARDTHMGRDLSPAIRDALNQLGKAEATRQHIEKYRDSIMEALADRRDRLEAKAAEKGVTVPEHKDYGIWRASIDQTMDIGERIIANRRADSIHFAGVALRGEGLGAAISRAHEALRDDDKQISSAAKRERRAERAAIRKDGYAHILEDPEAHRKRLEEAMKREHEASQKQGKGLSMGM